MNRFRLFAIALLLSLMTGTGFAAEKDKAIMLSVFGTSTEASATFDELLPLVQAQFPDREVAIPYTSSIIRNKLNKEIDDPAKKILSPAEMLERLKKDGYTDIAVVSTMVFPGVEHEKLKETVATFHRANSDLKIHYLPPMLADAAMVQPIVDTLAPHMAKDAFNVVVAHGTHDGHPVEEVYMQVAEAVANTYPNAMAGSIEGVPDMDEAIAAAGKHWNENVRFLVFMFVAGDHAENDVAGQEEDSLFSRVKAMGKKPGVVMVDTSVGKRMLSLGLDPAYRALLLEYYANNVQ